MSGIYGFWTPQCNIEQYKESINKLALWNKAYGNRAEESFCGEDMNLGCCYEKLSDTAKNSTPVLKKNEKYAVIDALLYNREELMEKANLTEELSDEELLFAYMEQFGMEGLKDINGDFCGAIYDRKDGELTLFRDHMGVRPLFYYADERCVAFSTDLRGLVAVEQMDVSVNEKWLWDDIVGTAFMGTENTEFAHIFCVRPASYMTFTRRKDSITSHKVSYWRLGSKKIRLSSEQAYIDRLRELITDSVRRRLAAVSEPVGAELSGGLDSGIIDILINRLGREAIYFSWSASPEAVPFAENDERLVIEDICRQEHITCHYGDICLNFDEESTITKKMRQIGLRQDMQEDYLRRYVLPPYINTLAIGEASHFISKRGAGVVFTGHGGDEGVSHRCNPYELFYHREYLRYLEYMWTSTKGEKHRIYDTFLRCRQNLTKSVKRLRTPFVSDYGAKDLLKADFYEKYSKEKLPALTFSYDATAYIEAGGSRNRLDVVALLGAYSGVRYLIPYLDYRVIDYAVSIPRHMYLKNKKNRYIFREAFKDMIPESLYNLTGKEENSWNNLESTSEEETDYAEKKKKLVEMLDREYWDKYLDWARIESWMKAEKTEEKWDKGMFRGISNCLRIQDIIARSREVGTTE